MRSLEENVRPSKESINKSRQEVAALEETPNLLSKLIEYGKSDFYAFHMPGHKRQHQNEFASDFPNPFSIDITEIHGFDNLHHPEGILKKSMEWAAGIYGSEKTYYLINGSSCGILSAISGTVSHGGTILMSRNCHKSAYHGVFLNCLKARYVYPQIFPDFGFSGGLLPEDVEIMLKKHPEIEAVFVVSPTYEGVVSDIGEIARIVHRFHLPLIVDEAHGAHFSFGKEGEFPVSALELGADVVVQSVHKTLPSFTQTALLHVKKGYVDTGRLERYLQIYQSSSPSYVMMAGIENCIRYMSEKGRKEMEAFHWRLEALWKHLSDMKRLRLLIKPMESGYGVYALDPSKVVISTRGTSLSGAQFGKRLREEFHLEMELCGPDYIVAIITLADTTEGLDRFCSALLKIDSDLQKQGSFPLKEKTVSDIGKMSESRRNIAQAMEGEKRRILLSEGEGMVSAEFIYIYPPGIPIVVPGEVLQKESIDLIRNYLDIGLSVQGMEDECGKMLWVAGK